MKQPVNLTGINHLQAKETQNMAKYCITCGTKNQSSATVCSNCGRPMNGNLSESDGLGKNSGKLSNTALLGNFDTSKICFVTQTIEDEIICEENSQNDFMYILSNKADLSATEYKVLNNSGNKGLLRCKTIQFNGKQTLYYMVGKLVSLHSMIPMLDAARFLYILENIFNQISNIRGNGFLLDIGLDLRINRIYVDSGDNQIYLTYVPIKQRCYSDEISLERKLRKDLAEIIKSTNCKENSNVLMFLQMLEEPSCSFNNLLMSLRQSRTVSGIQGN